MFGASIEIILVISFDMIMVAPVGYILGGSIVMALGATIGYLLVVSIGARGGMIIGTWEGYFYGS